MFIIDLKHHKKIKETSEVLILNFQTLDASCSMGTFMDQALNSVIHN